ncbi:MAG: hypothetical protein ACI4JG_05990 [Acutalibacteraceae bacterium]
MKSRKIVILTALTLIVALVFAACGNKGSEAGEQTTASMEETAAVTDGVSETEAASQDNSGSAQESQAPSVEQTTPAADPSSAETTAAETTKAANPAEKKGDIYKSVGKRKIWAGVVGEVYVVFKNTDTPNGSGMKGRIYELYVSAGDDGYSVWADGYWELNDAKTELKLTPAHQTENGNIGVAVGQTKTYTLEKGVFAIEFTFEQGGKTTVKLDPVKDAL